MTADLVIAGGGPAGLSTAIYGAMAGFKVTVFEPKPWPIDKSCGEGIMPSGVASLGRMHVQIRESKPFKGVRYIDRDLMAEGHFRTGNGLGIKRSELSRAMYTRAESLGVTMVSERLPDFEQGPDGVSVGDWNARWLVAADGLHSSVRTRAGIDIAQARRVRFGTSRHYRCAPWTDMVEVYLADWGEVYVTPVADDLIGVALMADDVQDFDDRLGTLSELRKKLTGEAYEIRGAGPFPRIALRRSNGRVFLVGDAAGFLDPITGEGVQLAFAAAEALIGCLISGERQDYERAWARIMRNYSLITNAVLTIRRSRLLSRLMVPTLGRVPTLFDRMLSLLGERVPGR